MSVSLSDIRAARERLRGIAHLTPVHRSRSIDRIAGARCHFKCESFQRIGAFKIRGAYNAISQLKEASGATGVLTYSSGNHAQAVALSCRLLEMQATIIMPENAPQIKLDATRGYGAEIVTYDPDETVREELAAEIAEERDLPIVPPYDHPDVIAGQGTVGLELLEQLPELDAVIVPCGGGGLLSGVATAIKSLRPEVRVIGAEPANADDATRSFRTGELHTVHNPDTIADGARTPSLGEHTFPLVLQHVDEMVTVSEEGIRRALRLVMERMKLVVEPTAVLGLGALLEHDDLADEETDVAIVLTGGNVDLARLPDLVNS